MTHTGTYQYTYECSAVRYYYISDANGTAWGLTDSSGTVVWSADYDSYGNATFSGTIDQPLRMPGQYHDTESGLYYNLARYYEPTTGRYLSVDPMRDAEDYTYAGGNPLKYVDPTGEIVILVHGTFASGADRTKATSDFGLAASSFFGGQSVRAFEWCGSDNTMARRAAGQRLADLINAIRLTNPNEQINVIAHSHGGNVVKFATQLGASIDNVINLGTPQNGTKFARGKAKNITNVYSNSDQVQVMGGSQYSVAGQEFGPAGRIDLQAQRNIRVRESLAAGVDEMSHSNLYTPTVLEQVWSTTRWSQ